MLFDEALADAKKLREIAELNAKSAIIESVTPKIKALIESQLLGESDEKDDEKDILLSVAEEMEDDKDASPEEILKKVGEKDEDEEKEISEGADEFVLNTESIKALKDLFNGETGLEVKLLQMENKYLRVDTKEDLLEVNDEINNLLKEIEENKDLAPEMLATYKKKLDQMKTNISKIFKPRNELVKENLNNLKDKMLRVKTSTKINNSQKNAYAIGILKEAQSLCDKANAQKSTLLKEEILELAKFLDEISNTYKEIYKMTKEKLNENELVLKLTIPDEVQLSADDPGLGIQIVGADGEEIGGDEMEMTGDMDDMGGDMPMGDEMSVDHMEPDGDEMEEEMMTYEAKDMSDDDVVEIDENMLRKELDKLKNLTEMDASVLDDFGDGEDVGEPFVDSDDADLNVNFGKTGRSVKKENKSSNAQELKESRRNRDLAKQLAEANVAVEKLRSQLKEVNLFNAKVLYVNQLLQMEGISSKQKLSIVDSLDKAKTLREAQLLFKSLTASLKSEKPEEKKTMKESVKRQLVLGSSSKPTTSATPAPAINENTEGYNRWAELAGISKK